MYFTVVNVVGLNLIAFNVSIDLILDPLHIKKHELTLSNPREIMYHVNVKLVREG